MADVKMPGSIGPLSVVIGRGKQPSKSPLATLNRCDLINCSAH